MTGFVTTMAAVMAVMVACSKPGPSNLNEMPRISGKMVLQKQPFSMVTFGELFYTVYSNGDIRVQGDGSFLYPGPNVEINQPFQTRFSTDAQNILSERHKNVGPNPIYIDRLAIQVLAYDPLTQESVVRVQLARSTHWSDVLWNFEVLHVVLDVSKPIIRFKRIDAINARAYYGFEVFGKPSVADARQALRDPSTLHPEPSLILTAE